IESGWGAVTPVAPVGEQLAGFGAYGVPAITSLDAGETLLDTPAVLGKNLARLARDAQAQVIVLPHNDLGSTLAPVIAAALDAALLTEVTTVLQVDGVLRLSRPAL